MIPWEFAVNYTDCLLLTYDDFVASYISRYNSVAMKQVSQLIAIVSLTIMPA